jgi:hypothetical protein
MFRRQMILLVFLLVAALRGAPPTIEVVAQKCEMAMMTENYQELADCTHHRIIENAGGRDAFIALSAKAMRSVHELGVTIIEAQAGTPGSEVQVGNWRVCLVPQKIVLKVEGGVFTSESFLVAIAEEVGGSWTLVDLCNLPEETRFALYPELKGKISIPETKPPVFSKDSKPANKAPEPTTPSGTPAADAPVAPAGVVAHL